LPANEDPANLKTTTDAEAGAHATISARHGKGEANGHSLHQNRDDAAEWTKIYTMIFPSYRLLIESYAKAQEVEKQHEQLDSQRAG
jgi:hypothetical protein